ncbi:hypothetical protein DV702_05385 [Sporosarcina sp. PTS2304]|uniref:hypothetical protein n=1 Tax=Sporosarcina sp. PTS2304 TaxID=2283194 RepID=UPI000E0D4491|nr:hypothetical protein [Sporosarcina sp. PTS2304]AXH99219.1 hypothetical protein DV702_05385 [Sporosarcina sp. PTS2304]
MDVSTELIALGAKFTNLVSKNSVPVVMDKIRLAKEAKEDSTTINSLEQIISELISEKNELIQIVQVYEEQLIMQKISDEDIDYITNSLIPIIEQLMEESDEESAAHAQKAMALFKPLLSKETFSILQMLGFNFKQAIGEPLTNLLKELIHSKVPLNSMLQYEAEILQQKVYFEELKIFNDEQAFERFKTVGTRQI